MSTSSCCDSESCWFESVCEIVGESFRFKDGRVLPPETPGLGIMLTDEIKARFPFDGGGEFNSVPGKILRD